MDPRIKVIISEMKRNISRAVPLSIVARRVNLSESRVRHLFRHETGISYAHYYKTLRIHEGKVLIEQDSFLTIKEVRVRIGFTSKEQFSRSFKKELGLTPKEYRSSCWHREPAISETE